MIEGVLVAGSSAITALICLHANEMGSILGVIDRPDGMRKYHARPTPLMGGLAVLVPFFLLLLVYRDPQDALPVPLAVFTVAGGLTLLGYLDDRQGLNAKFRLLAGSLLIALAVLIEPSQLIRSLDFGWTEVEFSAAVALGFTVLVVIGLINAVNMADGMNGLVPGCALIWTICLACYSPPSLLPLTIVLGALLGIVLLFNLQGKLFLGDAGAYGLAGLFSILTIDLYNRSEMLTADIVVAWFIVPVVDCLRLMASRALRGRSPFEADRDHLHHRLPVLVPSGFVVPVYWAMIAVPSIASILAPERSAYFIGGVVLAYMSVILLTSSRFHELMPGRKNRPQNMWAPGTVDQGR